MSSKGLVPMKLFSVGLSPSSAVCLYELLSRVMWSGGLSNWYVVLSLSVCLIYAVYVPVVPVIIQAQ